jgi:threonine/homoserine/homoserine lactone efflux protein
MTSNLSVWTALLAFTGAAGLLTIVPGLDTMLVLRTAMVEGPRRAMSAGLGICMGCLIWGVLVSVGLGAIFSVANDADHLLRIVGAGYLVYLGIRLATQPLVHWLRRPKILTILNRVTGGMFILFGARLALERKE